MIRTPITAQLLDSYCLTTELRESTETYYRRIASVFNAWAAAQGISEFTPQSVSEFLVAKQREGLSSHYRKSLRGGLRALLRHSNESFADCRVRPVKTDVIEPDAWTADEVAELVQAARRVYSRSPADEQYWRTIILVGYYTGASQIDIHRLTVRNFRADGLVQYVRSKTGKPVNTAVPVAFLADLPRGNPLWPLRTSCEMFRINFSKIVMAANLTGTFKKLRKSSGTSVDDLHPGRGHEHLGNTRKIFETHYRAVKKMELKPILPRLVEVE
jgi:integrase